MTHRTCASAVCLLAISAFGCSAGDLSDEPEDQLGATEESLIAPPPLPPLPDPDAPMCGGIAAIPCPGAGRCVDNPYDDCDPNDGGADCSGLCVCARPTPSLPRPLAPQLVCHSGEAFDASPEACACTPKIPDRCAAVRCKSGTHCITRPPLGVPVCVPDLPPAH